MRRLLIVMICVFVGHGPSVSIAADRLMDEIIVTATKREESVQDIPIAVSAYRGEDLDSRGVQDLYGLQEVSPSISVYSANSTSNGGTLRIRGVGTTGNNPGLEAAVGTFIDGVYRSRAGQAFSDLVDIERIEVLRGPQGTLFGKNTSAGALQILTQAPRFERSSNASLTAGDFGLLKGHVSATGPLSDTVAYRVALQIHQRDGYYEDDFTGDAYDRRDRYTIKAQLLFAPNDDIESRLIFDYTEKNEDCCPANYEFMNFTELGDSATTRGKLPGTAAGVIVNDLLDRQGRPQEFADFPSGDYQVGVNFKPYEEIEEWGLQNQLTWQLNDTYQLVSITAYREFDVNRGQDIDFSGADIVEPQFTVESFENFSQEFQLTWSGDTVDYLVGAYIYTEDVVTDENIRLASQGPEYLGRLILGLLDGDTGALLAANPAAPFGTTRGVTPLGTFDPATRGYVSDGAARPNYVAGDGYFADYAQDTSGWSVFTRNVLHLGDRWHLTLGLRYSSEKKEAQTLINGVAPVAGTTAEQMEAMLTNTFNEDHCMGFIYIGGFCNNLSWADSKTEKEWSGTATLGYDLSDQINVYGSYSRGYKAGGFNLDQQAIEMDIFATWLASNGDFRFLAPNGFAAAIPQEVLDATGGNGRNGLSQFPCGQDGVVDGAVNPNVVHQVVDMGPCAFFDDDHAFNPEFVDSFELGVKSTLMNGDLVANAAIFHSDFNDFQLNTFTGTGFLVSNTDQMISKGAELETTWFLNNNLMWTFGVTYADARYGDNLNRPNTSLLELAVEQEYNILEDWEALENIEGRRITHAPLWQGSTSLFGQMDIGNSMVGYGNLNIGFRGAHNTGSDLKPQKNESDKSIVNMQLGLRDMEDRWDVQFWARNVTDTQVDTLVFNSVFQTGSFSTFLNPPRMVGLTFSAKR